MKKEKLLDLYSDYLISAFGQTTATGLSALLNGEISHDNVQRHLLQFCKRVRKFVETVGAHLTEHFGLDQIRVHNLWYCQHRLIRKILAHTVCVFLNLMFNRVPFDLDGLVSA